METVWQDVKFGARMLLKNPGFTAVAVLTLALGIGANTTIFSAVNGWMFRPPTIREHNRVMVIFTTSPEKGLPWNRHPVSIADFVAWREQNQSFAGLVASEWTGFALTGEGEPERLTAMRVSAGYFQLLGVSASMGRTFLPGENQPGRDRVIVLSHGLWRQRFGASRDAVGKVLRLDGESYTVVGVMSRRYRLELSGPQLWTPLAFTAESTLPAARGNRTLSVLGRLKAGVTAEAADAEIQALALRSEQTHPGTGKGWGANTLPIQRHIADEFRAGMRPLMGAVFFVLLLACANIASLELARTSERQRELAVRAALGASRSRLIRQLLVESFLLALAGAGLGLLLASWGVALFRAGHNEYVQSMATEVTIDENVLAFTLSLAAFAAILFGLVPALRHSAPELHSTLKEGGRAGTPGRGRRRLHSVLVAAQIALALALLIGTGLTVQIMVQSFYSPPGIDPKQVLTARVSLPSARYAEASKQAAFFEEVVRRLGASPGVLSAGATTALPLTESDERQVTFSIEAQPPALRTERPQTLYLATSPGFLRALRIPLIRGRFFSQFDGAEAPAVAVVNQAFAQRYFPDEEAVGKRIRVDTADPDRAEWSEIVGIVGNVKTWIGEQRPRPQVYEHSLQRPAPVMSLVAQTSSDPAAFAPALRQAVWGVDKDQPIVRVKTMEEVIEDEFGRGRVIAVIMCTVAGLALSLAAVGVFGVMAYTAAQRTHEVGIRMALGAQKRDVLRLMLGKGLLLTVIGGGLGALLGVPLSQFVAETYETPDLEKLPVFLGAALLVFFAGLLASYIPARRATRLDPIVALRYE